MHKRARRLDLSPAFVATGLRGIAGHAASRDLGITFLSADGKGEDRRTWASLLEAGARRATQLVGRGVRAGDVVILVDGTSPALVEALFAVNHLGAVPVIAPPPQPWLGVGPRALEPVLRATSSRHVLVGRAILERLSDGFAQLGDVTFPLDPERPDALPVPRGAEHELAFVQFSSGSTRSPRGVLVPQDRVVHNLLAIADRAGVVPGDVMVSWLPLHHDMGLVAGLLGPAAWTGEGVLMDPMTFVHRPSRWLRAVARHRGTLTVAPNFGYELCLRLVRDRELEGLSLSTLRVAWNGAEPVLPRTVERFEDRFARFGLRPHVILPCYGAAEGTLEIASRLGGQPLLTIPVSRDALARGEVAPPRAPDDVLEVVSCGEPIDRTDVEILGPGGEVLDEGRVGEIVVSGPSICPGYLGMISGVDTGESGRLEDGRFFSGDLGFIHQGELFITGRRKDLIIVDGRNVYPFDVESAVMEAGEGVVRRAAAYGITDARAGSERVVVAVELAGRTQLDAALEQKLRAAAVVASRTASVRVRAVDHLPVTTSGKVQRHLVRASHPEGL